MSWQLVGIMLMLALASCGVIFRDTIRSSALFQPAPLTVPVEQTLAASPAREEQSRAELDDPPLLREHEPATETIFPHQQSPPSADADAVLPESSPAKQDEDWERVDSQDAAEPDDVKDQLEPKKKKATRGKRGGKKQKEKEQQVLDARQKKGSVSLPQPAGVISVAASESVSGPLQINSLIIHTDKVIGQGSCGTSVFEGSFEGRPVAVKRMLSQYYDLASQEVSFLQQSEDQPNVIKYYCKQEDNHFLYIALQLCQASLFEVWEPDKAKTDERHLQLSGLKHAIQQDVASKLWQLARGLYFLHSLRIIHRDIKPQNILVAFPKPNESNGPRLVISDFGLGEYLNRVTYLWPRNLY